MPERVIKAAADVSPLDAFGGKATREHRIRVRSQRSERLQFRRGLPLRPHVVLTTPINPKAFDARHSGLYTDVLLMAAATHLHLYRSTAFQLARQAKLKPGKFGFLALKE